MTIKHMYFNNSGSYASSGSIIPTIDNYHPASENFGVGMYPLLMRTFNISTPILAIISTPSSDSSLVSLVPFRNMYLDGPWTLPSSRTLYDYVRPTRMRMLLFVV